MILSKLSTCIKIVKQKEHNMSEEKFDYEEFAKSMYEQSLALVPEDIGVGDKEYLATTIKQFSLMKID